MLASRACQWRSLRALRPDVSAAYHSTLRRSAYSLNTARLQTVPHRFASSGPHWKTKIDLHQIYDDKNENWERSPWGLSTQAQSLNKRAALALKGGKASKALTTLSEKLPTPAPREVEQLGYHINRRMELKYAQDPLELAKFVSSRLSKGYEKQTLDLVRLASSKGINCVVSWNHMINHEFVNGRLKNAYKLYNEMKKRGQAPDAFTFTILLRGYAEHAHVGNVLGQALSIYHSMSAPNSKVPPSVIHTNAALKVCVRANNADAVWSIAAKIPDGGPNAANALTFTTILNFLRQSALISNTEGETEEQTLLRRERSIVDGRRIWVDVVGKWSASQLQIDEELVCAMGRLLLVGSRPRDWDDVLSLLAQTMDIPRLVPRLGTVTANGDHDKATQRLLEREPDALREVELEVYDPEVGPSRGAEFLPLTQRTVGSGKATPLLYAKPGNNTLSLVQEACLKIIANKESTAYWNLLTDPNTYGIEPDLNSLHMHLRLLRQNRASREAAGLLEREFLGPGRRPTRGTFRIAMSTCGRDKNNPNVIGHAGRIMDVMTSTLVDADSRASSMYADLVFNVARDGEAVKAALVKLEPVLASIKIQLGFGKDAGLEIVDTGTLPLSAQERTDAMETIRMIYRLYERIILRKEVADAEARPYIEGRSRLSALLNRLDYVLRRKATALRAKRNENKKDGEMPPELDGDDEEGENRKKVRARDRKDDVEVFEAWEKRSSEIRGRGKRRTDTRKEQRPEREPRRDEADQWDRFDRFKGRQYREASGQFGTEVMSEWLTK